MMGIDMNLIEETVMCHMSEPIHEGQTQSRNTASRDAFGEANLELPTTAQHLWNSPAPTSKSWAVHGLSDGRGSYETEAPSTLESTRCSLKAEGAHEECVNDNHGLGLSISSFPVPNFREKTSIIEVGSLSQEKSPKLIDPAWSPLPKQEVESLTILSPSDRAAVAHAVHWVENDPLQQLQGFDRASTPQASTEEVSLDLSTLQPSGLLETIFCQAPINDRIPRDQGALMNALISVENESSRLANRSPSRLNDVASEAPEINSSMLQSPAAAAKPSSLSPSLSPAWNLWEETPNNAHWSDMASQKQQIPSLKSPRHPATRELKIPGITSSTLPPFLTGGWTPTPPGAYSGGTRFCEGEYSQNESSWLFQAFENLQAKLPQGQSTSSSLFLDSLAGLLPDQSKGNLLKACGTTVDPGSGLVQETASAASSTQGTEPKRLCAYSHNERTPLSGASYNHQQTSSEMPEVSPVYSPILAGSPRMNRGLLSGSNESPQTYYGLNYSLSMTCSTDFNLQTSTPQLLPRWRSALNQSAECVERPRSNATFQSVGHGATTKEDFQNGESADASLVERNSENAAPISSPKVSSPCLSASSHGGYSEPQQHAFTTLVESVARLTGATISRPNSPPVHSLEDKDPRESILEFPFPSTSMKFDLNQADDAVKRLEPKRDDSEVRSSSSGMKRDEIVGQNCGSLGELSEPFRTDRCAFSGAIVKPKETFGLCEWYRSLDLRNLSLSGPQSENVHTNNKGIVTKGNLSDFVTLLAAGNFKRIHNVFASHTAQPLVAPTNRGVFPSRTDSMGGGGSPSACDKQSDTDVVQVEAQQTGSAGHPLTCKPCAFYWTKRCNNGDSCAFCHEWHAPKKKKPMKDQKNLMIIARPDGKIEFLRCAVEDAVRLL